jgi:hypothetical protein
VTGGVEGGHARRHLRAGLDQAQARAGQFQIRLGDQWLLLGGHFAGQFGVAPEGHLGLASDEFGRGEQQRRVLAVTDTPQVVEVEVSEQDHVDIAWRVARAGEVGEQPAGRVLELVDAAACVDQHQLVARVDKDSVDLQSHRARRLESGCEQASSYPGKVSATVGTSGNASKRVVVVTASDAPRMHSSRFCNSSRLHGRSTGRP